MQLQWEEGTAGCGYGRGIRIVPGHYNNYNLIPRLPPIYYQKCIHFQLEEGVWG